MSLSSFQDVIASKLSNLIPESHFKNRLSCLYSNYMKKNSFKINYYQGYYIIYFNGVVFKLLTKHAEDVFNLGYLEKYKIKERDIVVDAGAFAGAFAIYAGKVVGENGKVIAFEPDKSNYEILIKNINLNKLNNIIPFNKGLWSENATLKFASSHDESSTFFYEGERCCDFIEVDVVSLDNELSDLKFRRVDFIKMDIEGSELEAIKGARKILRNHRVNLAIASYHVIDGEQTCFKLRDMLTSMGYDTEIGFPSHLTVYARPHDWH